MPEPGEYANSLPGILQRNDRLKPMRLSRIKWGMNYSRAAWQSELFVRFARIDRPFILTKHDSAYQFVNRGDALQYSSFGWQFKAILWKKLSLRLLANGHFENVSPTYLFWSMPFRNFRIEIGDGLYLFQRDIYAHLLLRAVYYGKRNVPQTLVPENLTLLQELPGFWQADAVLRLHFRDAIIFLNLQNIFNQEAQWRPLQPIRSRTFRLGLNWLFLN